MTQSARSAGSGSIAVENVVNSAAAAEFRIVTSIYARIKPFDTALHAGGVTAELSASPSRLVADCIESGASAPGGAGPTAYRDLFCESKISQQGKFA